jgi:hypothetical protein
MSRKLAINTRLYVFYFNKIEKPIKILSKNKQEARMILSTMMPSLPAPYQYSVVTDEKVESLVHGHTSIIMSGVKHLWHRDKGWVRAKNE